MVDAASDPFTVLLGSLQQEVARVTEANAELSAALNEAAARDEERDQHVRSLNALVSKYEREREESRAEAAAIDAAEAKARSVAQSKLIELEAQVSAREHELRLAQAREAAAGERIAALEAELQQAAACVSARERELRLAQASEAAAGERIVALEAELQQATSGMADLASSLRKRRKAFEERQRA